MTQFTNVKYMESELASNPSSDTKNTVSSELSVISNNTNMVLNAKNIIDTPDLLNEQQVDSSSASVKPVQNNIVKKQYLLPLIYKTLFVYFNKVFLNNKPQQKNIENMNEIELRNYVDQLSIRNMELKAYCISLENWQEKFEKNSLTNNSNNKISKSKINKNGSKKINSISKNKISNIKNGPSINKNKSANMINKSKISKPAPKPITTKSVSSSSVSNKHKVQVKLIKK